MKDISILDNIFEIEENIKSNLNYIIKGRRLDELSDEELILLKELYLLINKQLENRIEFKKKKISDIREKISNIIYNK